MFVATKEGFVSKLACRCAPDAWGIVPSVICHEFNLDETCIPGACFNCGHDLVCHTPNLSKSVLVARLRRWIYLLGGGMWRGEQAVDNYEWPWHATWIAVVKGEKIIREFYKK